MVNGERETLGKRRTNTAQETGYTTGYTAQENRVHRCAIERVTIGAENARCRLALATCQRRDPPAEKGRGVIAVPGGESDVHHLQWWTPRGPPHSPHDEVSDP